MLSKTIGALSTVLAALLAMVRCEPPTTQYGTPLAPPINNYGGAGSDHHFDHHNDHHDGGEPKAYEFGYQVKDDYSGNNYNRQEASDGNQVKGEYRVALPDGRTQIVTYYADWKTGFHADVRYEGTASYPDRFNNNNYQGGYNQPSNQYGAPGFGNYQGNYNNGYNNNGVASSTVSIKDFSSGSTPFNVGNNYNNFNGQYSNNAGQGYDSYSNAAVGFGNHGKPSTAYGAP